MEVVHIEHGIRGQDSLADANYVEKPLQRIWCTVSPGFL